jgi:hypothetical protein
VQLDSDVARLSATVHPHRHDHIVAAVDELLRLKAELNKGVPPESH